MYEMLKIRTKPPLHGGAAFGVAYKELMPSLRNAWNSEAYDEDKRVNRKIYEKTASALAAADMSTPIPPLRLRAVLTEATTLINKIMETATDAKNLIEQGQTAYLNQMSIDWNELVGKVNPLLIGPVNVGMSDEDTNALHSLISNQLLQPLEMLQAAMAANPGVQVENAEVINSTDIARNILLQVRAKYYKPVPFGRERQAGPGMLPPAPAGPPPGGAPPPAYGPGNDEDEEGFFQQQYEGEQPEPFGYDIAEEDRVLPRNANFRERQQYRRMRGREGDEDEEHLQEVYGFRKLPREAEVYGRLEQQHEALLQQELEATENRRRAARARFEELVKKKISKENKTMMRDVLRKYEQDIAEYERAIEELQEASQQERAQRMAEFQEFQRVMMEGQQNIDRVFGERISPAMTGLQQRIRAMEDRIAELQRQSVRSPSASPAEVQRQSVRTPASRSSASVPSSAATSFHSAASSPLAATSPFSPSRGQVVPIASLRGSPAASPAAEQPQSQGLLRRAAEGVANLFSRRRAQVQRAPYEALPDEPAAAASPGAAAASPGAAAVSPRAAAAPESIGDYNVRILNEAKQRGVRNFRQPIVSFAQRLGVSTSGNAEQIARNLPQRLPVNFFDVPELQSAIESSPPRRTANRAQGARGARGDGRGRWTDYSGPVPKSQSSHKKPTMRGGNYRDTPSGNTPRQTKPPTINYKESVMDFHDESNDPTELGGIAKRDEMLQTENKEVHLDPDWKGLPKRLGAEKRLKKMRKGYVNPRESYL